MDLQQITISPLADKASLNNFGCGEREIDRWVKDKAFKHQQQHRTRVFTAHLAGNPLACGFYSLQIASESASKLTDNYKDIYKSGGVPLIYIGFLAVLRNCQCQGLGTFLLMNALSRCYSVSHHVPFYGVALRSLNERTTTLYEKFGFGLKETEANPLMILPVWSLIDLMSAAPTSKAI